MPRATAKQTEQTILTVKQRLDNIRRALTRDGSQPLDVERAMVMRSIEIMCERGFTRSEIQLIINDIIDAVHEDSHD